MRIRSIALSNWTRFRGQHQVDLGPTVYAVMARQESDEERSNWCGKTRFLFAVPFALYGRHLEQLEDNWITRGEKAGAVELELDDGTVIRRERKVGKSTQLTVKHLVDGESVLAKGPDAQRVVEEKVGLSEADFFASCFFEQKQMARFIRAKPAERNEVIGAWLNLEPLQRCEENVRRRLGAHLADGERLAKRLDVLSELKDTAVRRYIKGELEGVDVIGGLEAKLATLEAELDGLKAKGGELQEQIDEHAGWIVAAQSAQDYQDTVAQGVELKKEIEAGAPRVLEGELAAATKAEAEAAAVRKAAQEELGKAKRLVQGEFDGQCPVMKAECPAAAKVRATVEGNARLMSEAAQLERAAAVNHGECAARRAQVEGKLRVLRDKNTRLVALRERARVLKPAWDQIQADGPPPDTTEVGAQLREVLAGKDLAAREYYALKSVVADVREWAAEWDRILVEQAELAGAIQTTREALIIVGRNGAQRELARAALEEIEADANALLSESGIALSLAVCWAREAAEGLARACDQCGAPFPTSQRVKKCEKCGAERGPLTVNKLEVVLSDTSGAAEDLAGIAFQLAAAAWLRRSRGASWSVAVLDEPFGALDEHNRRALATHLTAMLRSRYGFEQSFVVAHDRGVMDALPARVEIVAGEDGSRFSE